MLSNSGKYGIRACEYLALQSGDIPVSTKKISRELDMPNEYLVKVLQKLKKAGLVRSKRGSNGGVLLARPASEIFLIDIIQASNPSFIAMYTDKGKPDTKLEQSALFKDLEYLSDITFKFIEESSLSDFSKNRSIRNKKSQ
jgi:Rrf2 family protein